MEDIDRIRVMVCNNQTRKDCPYKKHIWISGLDDEQTVSELVEDHVSEDLHWECTPAFCYNTKHCNDKCAISWENLTSVVRRIADGTYDVKGGLLP